MAYKFFPHIPVADLERSRSFYQALGWRTAPGMEAGHSIAETARAAGFGSTETLRRTFAAQFDVSPSQYRARFASTGTEDRPR